MLERIASVENIIVNNGSGISIGKLLKKHGFLKKKKRGVYKYAIKPKNGINIEKYQ